MSDQFGEVVAPNIRIISAAISELLRQLVLDLTRRYQPIGRPPGHTQEQNP